MGQGIAFALTAGTLAALNPCGFAMLPAYLTLFVAGGPDAEGSTNRLSDLRRALVATGAMTSGFLAVFGVFGLLLTPVASTVQRWLPTATVVIGAILVLLGAFMLTGRSVVLRTPHLGMRNSPTGPWTMALYGVSYAVASLGCTIGPFLVVTATTFRDGDIIAGSLAYAAYAIGMGLVVGVLAVTAAVAQPAVTRALRRAMPHVTRLGGALLVLVGAYVAWYGAYELRVYAGGDPEDPIVAAASGIQSVLASGVERLGPGFFALSLLALATLVAFGPVLARRRGKRSTRRENTLSRRTHVWP